MGCGYSPKRTGIDAFAKMFRDLGTSVADVNRRITAIGVQVDKANGKLIVSAGRSLEVDGSLTVTGDTLIEGNLSVLNGSITNDALENPITPKIANGSNHGFALSMAGVNAATATLAVPSGYRQALVFATSDVMINNK